MRRLSLLIVVLGLLSSACGDDTESGDGPPIEGITVEGSVDDTVDDRDGDDSPDGDDGGGIGDGGEVPPPPADEVPPLPDIDDLELDPDRGVGADFVFEPTDDPCADLESIILGPNGAALMGLSEDVQQEVFYEALAPFGDDALATVEAVIASGPDMADDEVVELFTAFDGITLAPCGWPLLGALSAVSEASLASFDDDPASHPDVLPCFAERDVDADLLFTLGQPWQPIDCETGVDVEWSSTERAWVEASGDAGFEIFEDVDEAIG